MEKKRCPHGSYVSYPIGTIKKVMVGDECCKNCPLYPKDCNEARK